MFKTKPKKLYYDYDPQQKQKMTYIQRYSYLLDKSQKNGLMETLIWKVFLKIEYQNSRSWDTGSISSKKNSQT